MGLSMWSYAVLLSYAAMAASAFFIWLQFAYHAPALVYVRPSVFTVEECEHAIRVAEQANVWTQDRHKTYPTDDFNVNDVPELANVSRAVDERVLPLLRELYGVRADMELSVHDLFLIRYTSSKQAGLKMHVDITTLSFGLALSEPEAYGGGGIQFDLLEAPIRVDRGATVLHPSKLRHSGVDVHEGTRYVLVGFVSVADDPMLTFGDSGPGSPELLHGQWATCAQLVVRDVLGLPSGLASPVPASMTQETCYAKWRVVARQLWFRGGVIREGLASLWEGEGLSNDAFQLLVLNGCLLVGSIAFLHLVG